MSINERTKYRIANKWDFEAKKFNQDQFDFEDRGSFAFGKMNWSIKKTNKADDSISFDSSSIKFICFGDAKELIANNLGSKFALDASLSNKPFKDKNDKWKDSWGLTIFKAEIVEGSINHHSTNKSSAQTESNLDEDELLDCVPF